MNFCLRTIAFAIVAEVATGVEVALALSRPLYDAGGNPSRLSSSELLGLRRHRSRRTHDCQLSPDLSDIMSFAQARGCYLIDDLLAAASWLGTLPSPVLLGFSTRASASAAPEPVMPIKRFPARLITRCRRAAAWACG